MNLILRSTAILSGSSIASIIVGLLTAKGWVVLLGPSGMGYMGLLQSLLSLAGLLAAVGISTSVVRATANPLRLGQMETVAALRRAAWVIVLLFGNMALLLLTLLRTPISEIMLGGREHEIGVVLIGIALLFSMAAGLQTSILNTYGRIGALAKLGLLNTILGAGISLLLVWQFGEAGIAPGIIAGAALSFTIASFFVRRDVPAQKEVAPSLTAVRAAVKTLLGFGLPYSASVIVGMGVQMLIPALVLHSVGEAGVGYYRAAITISVTYLSFILTAMAQDYYPRVAAIKDQPAQLISMVNGQHRLIMLLSLPLILGLLALAPYLVPLVYSSEFTPTVDVLEWQLIGDVFKYSSWTMAIVVLARSRSLVFFGTELVSGLATIGGAWLGVSLFGLAGLGFGFLLSYAVYYVAVWLVVRREIGFQWTRENRLLLAGAVAATLLVRALPVVGLEILRTPVALLLAALAGVGALWVLRADLGLKLGATAVRPGEQDA